MKTKRTRSVPFRPEPYYDYLRCRVCTQLTGADLVCRIIGDVMYFGHERCFHGKTDVQITGAQQMTIDEL